MKHHQHLFNYGLHLYPDFAFPRSQSRLTLPLVHNIRHCLFYDFLSIVTLIFVSGIFVKNLYSLNPALFKSSSLSSCVFFGIGTVNNEHYVQDNYQPPSTRLFITFDETRGCSQERTLQTAPSPRRRYFPIKLLVIHFKSCDTLYCHVFCTTQRPRSQSTLPERSCKCHCNLMYFNCLKVTC